MDAEAPEKRRAFGGFIGPKNLLVQVQNTAPWLFDGSHPDIAKVPTTTGERLIEHGFHPLGWWSILRHAHLLSAQDDPSPRDITDYFALCLAAHAATVTTYVPTDVDTKIRHALWHQQTDMDELSKMKDLALFHLRWDVRPVNARLIDSGDLGAVSVYDGERLSVLCGALLGLYAAERTSDAGTVAQAIDDELWREARIFESLRKKPGREVDALNAATALTHNAGDIMQAFEAKGVRRFAADERVRFGELSGERPERFGGAFAKAGLVYRELLASEGHRHYPLREQKLLRTSHEILLPNGPFLEPWGQKLARHQGFDVRARAEVLTTLIDGCRKVPGQEGYFRALVGFDEAYPGGIQARDLDEHLGAAARKQLKDATLRKKISVRKDSFLSSYVKRMRALLG